MCELTERYEEIKKCNTFERQRKKDHLLLRHYQNACIKHFLYHSAVDFKKKTNKTNNKFNANKYVSALRPNVDQVLFIKSFRFSFSNKHRSFFFFSTHCCCSCHIQFNNESYRIYKNIVKSKPFLNQFHLSLKGRDEKEKTDKHNKQSIKSEHNVTIRWMHVMLFSKI